MQPDLNLFFKDNSRLVWWFLHKFNHRNNNEYTIHLEDMFQHAAEHIIRYSHSYEYNRGCKFTTYVAHLIWSSLKLFAHKHKLQITTVGIDWIDNNSVMSEDWIEEIHTMIDLERQMADLPAQQKMTIYMRRQGYTFKEIANINNVTVQGERMRENRIRAKLKKRLKAYKNV